MTFLINDNEGLHPAARFDEPDAHGQAAMLLVESLIHTLVARSVISLEDAIEVTTVAFDVKKEIAVDLGDTNDTMDKSAALLSRVLQSLSNDLI
ncbi:hypothetical protein U1707_17225 [Sphingomonas sp. PB2P12]|uniref:hypothetical protein n=1 Tax=Sphingomonas sandaracina TaxID=3096157 RepID=UPI002FCAF2A8